jgi:hypothetical protein
MDAVSVIEDVVRHYLGERVELSAFFGFGKVSEFCRQVAESHYYKAGAVLARTTCKARQALSAIPNDIAFEQLFDFFVVSALDGVHYLARVVFIELGSRTYGSACTAVDTRLQAFLYPVVLFQYVV